ncbi:hypothetical protein [Burkholderia glumae]|nr:hypothetical protein [Burkholderia glumae]QKM51958.1 hypothetical protein B7760_06036 [Burkholderia glumae]
MNREQREEASRRWVQAAAQTAEAQAMIALGWQVVRGQFKNPAQLV